MSESRLGSWGYALSSGGKMDPDDEVHMIMMLSMVTMLMLSLRLCDVAAERWM